MVEGEVRERVFIVIYYVYRLFILRVCCSVAIAFAGSLIDLPASVRASVCVRALCWRCNIKLHLRTGNFRLLTAN